MNIVNLPGRSVGTGGARWHQDYEGHSWELGCTGHIAVEGRFPRLVDYVVDDLAIKSRKFRIDERGI